MPAPVANYVDFVRVGNLLFLAGNTAGADWKFKGKVGKDITVQEGYETARQVGLIMLAKVRAALGSLDRVKRIVKVLGMVNSPEGFGDQPRVVNGFSDLMVEVFGEQVGKHARSAVGMQALPSDSAVEVEMIVEVRIGSSDVLESGAANWLPRSRLRGRRRAYAHPGLYPVLEEVNDPQKCCRDLLWALRSQQAALTTVTGMFASW